MLRLAVGAQGFRDNYAGLYRFPCPVCPPEPGYLPLLLFDRRIRGFDRQVDCPECCPPGDDTAAERIAAAIGRRYAEARAPGSRSARR